MSDKSPIIVAIDTPDVDRAKRILQETCPYVGCFKIGLEFFSAQGISGVDALRNHVPGIDLFLDLKLHDIPNTVAGAARTLARLEPRFLTVHASGGGAMVAAARDALPTTNITAVTVLTSLDQEELTRLGLSFPIPAWTTSLAANAIENGAKSLVSSPHEVASLRANFGSSITLITPGVRPVEQSESSADDQKRVMTPIAALRAGANFLVIGRPITAAKEPGAAAAKILQEISSIDLH